MEERIKSGRGRGLCIRRNGKIVAVAQSEFEMDTSALIVGVATDPASQGKGLGSTCVEALCSQLLKEGKDLYLQYDNMDAGRIYERLGFRPFDQVKHYEK
jgi:predicted GNAT family acetyltransferase